MAIESDAQRLACYEQGRRRPSVGRAEEGHGGGPALGGVPARRRARGDCGRRHSDVLAPGIAAGSCREERKLGTYNVRGYKPIYLMPAFVTDDRNESPPEPNPDNTVSSPESLDDLEAKFQLSLKTKGVAGSLRPRWRPVGRLHPVVALAGLQLAESRPFRETTTSPRPCWWFDTHYDVLGWQGRLLGNRRQPPVQRRVQPAVAQLERIIADVGCRA